MSLVSLSLAFWSQLVTRWNSTLLHSILPFPSCSLRRLPSSPCRPHSPMLHSIHPGTGPHSFAKMTVMDDTYIVTELSYYKEQLAWPDCQHEYLILLVQLRPSSNQSSAPDGPGPFQFKVSCTITGRSLPARLGLWGHAENTIKACGSAAAAATIQDQHQWIWKHLKMLYKIIINPTFSIVSIIIIIRKLIICMCRYRSRSLITTTKVMPKYLESQCLV